MKIYLPKGSIDYEKNNLFNCNLNTLKDFFPINGFPLPKDTKILNISWYFLSKNYNKVKEQYEIYKSPADKYNNTELYYDFMLEDIGLERDPNNPSPPVKYIFHRKLNEYVDMMETDDVDINEINDIVDRLYIYNLLADKNLSHAKDELKRMRLSVTAMGKRLNKEDLKIYMGSYSNEIKTLVDYNRFILDTYQWYIENKTLVSKELYKHLLRLLKYYYNNYSITEIPSKLFNMIDESRIML